MCITVNFVTFCVLMPFTLLKKYPVDSYIKHNQFNLRFQRYASSSYITLFYLVKSCIWQHILIYIVGLVSLIGTYYLKFLMHRTGFSFIHRITHTKTVQWNRFIIVIITNAQTLKVDSRSFGFGLIYESGRPEDLIPECQQRTQFIIRVALRWSH